MKVAFTRQMAGKEFQVRKTVNAKMKECGIPIWERAGQESQWCGGRREGRLQMGLTLQWD